MLERGLLCGFTRIVRRPSTSSRSRGSALMGLVLVSLQLTASGCGSSAHSPTPPPDSETHFLRACTSDCPGDLQCICGVCSLTCDPASDCGDAHERASCVAASEFADGAQCATNAEPSVCDVDCMQDADCEDVGPTHTCEAGHCRVIAQSSASCMHEGVVYLPGEHWNDGCNDCGCGEDGMVGCTRKDCSAVSCNYDRMTYQPGDTFLATDGCNQCVCGQDGNVGCDDAVCADPACSGPFESGSCAAAFEVYWYDEALGRCELVTYGGCGGNENRYATLQECETACGVPSGSRTACLVDGAEYADGSTVPDPFSCNSCTCDGGAISACTEIGCSTPCPEGTTPGESCAECGPVGGCAVMETACLPVCGNNDECTTPGYDLCDAEAGHCIRMACL
jgi:hypothetical protein